MWSTVLAWLDSPALTAFDTPTSWAELLGFLTGALCVYWVARRSIWNWPTGIANNLLFIVLFTTAGLYADAALQVVYVGLAVYGWYHWLRPGAGAGELPVGRLTPREAGLLLAAAVALLLPMVHVLDAHTGSTVPWADSVTTVLSLAATWCQCRKLLESWYLWIAADVVYVPLYLSKGLTLTAILYAGFLCLCVYGWYTWRARYRFEQAARREPAGLAA